jgi:hypothetical protein
MIASISDDNNTGGSADNRRRHRYRNNNDPNLYSPPPQHATVEMLQNLNTSRTAASLVLNDTSANKVTSFRALAAQSTAARNLLPPLETNAPTLALDRENIINVLKLLGNIYDNSIEIISTE